jgi:hypothetical protein
MKPRKLPLLFLVFLFSSLMLFSSCEKNHVSTSNKPPHVIVTGGPPQGGVANYYVTISWVGWDEDGVVKYFIFAIDDTTHWTEIRELEQTFIFTADSLREGEEFGRWHTFWIEAVDNDGARSRADYLTFDARTVAPKTTILVPTCDPEGLTPCEGPLVLGTSVRVVWEGEDPDSRDASKKPVAYQWRLFNLSKFGLLQGCPYILRGCVEFLDSPPYVPDSTSFWSEPTTQTEIRFTNLQAGAYWLFGVRAIDEAGAVEPFPHIWGNAIYFTTLPGYGTPELKICQGSNCHEYPADGLVWQRNATANRQINLTWVGDASPYGGTISGYRWGVDISNLDDPSQWETGWGPDITSASLSFSQPGVHRVYVQVKDYADAVQLGIVEFNVSEFLFDRDVLYVDDYFDIIPGDAAHDAFINSILTRCRQYTDSVYVFSTYPSGPGRQPPEVASYFIAPSLEELSRYKFVIWDCYGPQNNFTVALNEVITKGVLQQYLDLGGRLWVYGNQTMKASTPGHFYPMDFSDPSLSATFPHEYLKISGVVDRAMYNSTTKGDGFRGATPNRAISDMLPILDVDSTKAGTGPQGLWQIEAVMSAMQEQDLSQRPDTLFFYRANSGTSRYNNKACGLRFHDTYSGSKVVYLGFPTHYFLEASAESLVTFVTDWMFEDMSTTPRGVVRK